MIDLLYLCHGRIEFTRATLTNLYVMTDWSLVNDFVVYHDRPCDEQTEPFLTRALDDFGFGEIRTTDLGSPVGVMNHYLHRSRAEVFAKIDNDIIVPGGWFGLMAGVMTANPELELLGMEPGMSGRRPDEDDSHNLYHYEPASHIGGVGMMRRSAFQRLPEPVPNGRFGFTEWQHTHNPDRGWIKPDLRMFSLDFLPVEPWQSLTEQYMKTPGLQREWPKYNPSMSWSWEWWTG